MLSKTQNQLIIEQRYRQTNIKLIGMCINRSALFTSKDDSMTSRGLHHCDLLQNVLISTSNQTCTFKLITNLCFDIKSISWNVKLVIMFIIYYFIQNCYWLACYTMMQDGVCKSHIISKSIFLINIWPLTCFDFFFFLLPSETTGSSVSTKSKSQISMCGSIVPTATKLTMGKKWESVHCKTKNADRIKIC